MADETTPKDPATPPPEKPAAKADTAVPSPPPAEGKPQTPADNPAAGQPTPSPPQKPTAPPAAAKPAAPAKPAGPTPQPWESDTVATLKRQFGSGIKEAVTYVGQAYMVVDATIAHDVLQL